MTARLTVCALEDGPETKAIDGLDADSEETFSEPYPPEAAAVFTVVNAVDRVCWA
jgi:hypothetical protein